MLGYKKNKIKMSLIEDYIQLCLVQNFCNNDFSFVNNQTNFLFMQLQQTLKIVLSIYNQTFIKLRMNDLSLLILKKELKNRNYLYYREEQNEFKNLDNTLNILSAKVENIIKCLKEKQKALKLTPLA